MRLFDTTKTKRTFRQLGWVEFLIKTMINMYYIAKKIITNTKRVWGHEYNHDHVDIMWLGSCTKHRTASSKCFCSGDKRVWPVFVNKNERLE